MAKLAHPVLTRQFRIPDRKYHACGPPFLAAAPIRLIARVTPAALI
jgi:hypothetical protein